MGAPVKSGGAGATGHTEGAAGMIGDFLSKALQTQSELSWRERAICMAITLMVWAAVSGGLILLCDGLSPDMTQRHSQIRCESTGRP